MPGEGPLLLDLFPLVGYIVAAGMVWALYGIVKGFGGLLGTVFKWTSPISVLLESPVNAGFKWLDHELGSLAQKLDHQIAVSFHRVARVVIDTAELFIGVSGLILLLAYQHLGLKSLVHLIRQEVHIGKVKQSTTHAVADHAARAARVAKDTTESTAKAVAGEITLPRVGGLEHDVAGLRERVRTAEHEIGRVYDYARANAGKLATVTGVAAVAGALIRLGLGWTKCNNVGNTGKRICGMNPNLLESLLADTLIVAGTLSLVEFARELVPVTEAAVEPIRLFWRVR